jgi:outer membrane protein assembly factor BamB
LLDSDIISYVRLAKTLAALLIILTSGYAADWLSLGADPQGSGWQRHGKTLTVENSKDLKLLWKRQLDDPSIVGGWLSAPVILGPTITHRGVRELVFIADAHDNLYAIDADLGTLFWKRHFDVSPMAERTAESPCHPGMPATPVIEPDPDEDVSGNPVTDDEDDDEPGPMRPLYAVSSDGRLHTIRVSDGTDTSVPIEFLPPHANYSSLNYWSGVVYAGSFDDCGRAPHGVWSINVKKSDATPEFYSAGAGYRIVIGPTGEVYGAVGNGTVSLQPGSLRLKRLSKTSAVDLIAFNYQGRELIAGQAQDGSLFLLDALNLGFVAGYRDPRDQLSGLASWQDPKGTRWVYTSTRRNVQALKLSGPPGKPELKLAWTFANVTMVGPAAITNGIVFVLSGDVVAGAGRNTLRALDAETGKELFSSGPTIRSLPYVPYLAVANGHICFGTTDNSLYCFGLPMER